MRLLEDAEGGDLSDQDDPAAEDPRDDVPGRLRTTRARAIANPTSRRKRR